MSTKRFIFLRVTKKHSVLRSRGKLAWLQKQLSGLHADKAMLMNHVFCDPPLLLHYAGSKAIHVSYLGIQKVTLQNTPQFLISFPWNITDSAHPRRWYHKLLCELPAILLLTSAFHSIQRHTQLIQQSIQTRGKRGYCLRSNSAYAVRNSILPEK